MPKSKLINIKEFKEILNNLSPDYQVRVYDVSKGRRVKVMKPKKSIIISERVGRLETKVDQLGTTVDKLVMTVDKLGMTVEKLAKEMNARFDSLESDVKDINARLDYIVQANNLKDSK